MKRTNIQRDSYFGLCGLLFAVLGASSIDLFGPAGALIFVGMGATLMALSVRDLRMSMKPQQANQISLNPNRDQLDVDKLDHEFKKLETEFEQQKESK